MKHLTHKSWLKWIGGTILTMSLIIGASFSSAVNAQPTDMRITQEVKKEVACFVYARHLGLATEVIGTHLQRIGKASETAGAVYHLGYTEGLLAGLAASNAEVLGSYKAAKIHAAEYLYNTIGCTINESI